MSLKIDQKFNTHNIGSVNLKELEEKTRELHRNVGAAVIQGMLGQPHMYLITTVQTQNVTLANMAAKVKM